MSGWSLLLEEARAARGRPFPIRAYSEFMPPPRLAPKPYEEGGARADDSWHVTEFEERRELAPALAKIALHVVTELEKLARGTSHHLGHSFMRENPAWPESLAASAGKLSREPYIVCLPLALSRTQDDKGRVRWTLFGASHEGPWRAFWKSFEESEGTSAFERFLAWAHGEPKASLAELHRAGVRILPSGADPDFPEWGEEKLPPAARDFVLRGDEAASGVRTLLTFRPFARLPLAIREAYLGEKLRLVPTPSSLVFFHGKTYRSLARELLHAAQVPLLQLFHHCENTYGIRIPQSGWLAEHVHGKAPASSPQRVLRRVERTHRWQRVALDAELHAASEPDESQHTHAVTALFSNAADDLGLYGKPMARNAQVWTERHGALLDGPSAGRVELLRAREAVLAGGHFGFRFYFPPARVGERSIFWHRPLVARRDPASGSVSLLESAPLGHVSAERAGSSPVFLRPQILDRPGWREAATIFDRDPGHRRFTTAQNVRKLLESRELLASPLEPSFARRLLTCPKSLSFKKWLARLPEHSSEPEQARALAKDLRQLVRPGKGLGFAGRAPRSLTYGKTATRAFEETYWKTIQSLAEGEFREKDNADSISSNEGKKGGERGASRSVSPKRDLDALALHLQSYYHELIGEGSKGSGAFSGFHEFRWETDWDLPWSQGWVRNQTGEALERNVVCVIPGRDRGSAIVMADHYDTAYMEDLYEPSRGGDKLRAAAAGADDNHSATAALMLAAPVLLELSREGRLARDVWLVHLTGEEFPADCLGARALAQRLLERNLSLSGKDGERLDLSRTRVAGAFVLDMIAHQNDHERNVFQISPGEGAASARLALGAHVANERWNRSVPGWNRSPERRGKHGKRLSPGESLPAIAQHPRLSGEVRPRWHPRSSIYNTDGVIFSDLGIPVVLFMENYDIRREGYHDTKDTMALIDLDYGAALAAIAIEAVAIAATSE